MNSLKQPAHPNLKHDYFKIIDTKEKAYWLGFLFADGNVFKNKVSITASLKDEEWMKKYINIIGANPNKNYKFLQKSSGRIYYIISIHSKELSSDLKNLGCLPRKSKIIRFPKLDNLELDKAFLMGYFDGDGRESSTEFYSGSKLFLEDVKEKFEISFSVKEKKQKYECYELTLGAKFFKELLINYPDSLPRKRKTHGEQKYLFNDEISFVRSPPPNKGKRVPETHKVVHPSKEELFAKVCVEKVPFTTLGKLYGVSDNSVRKWCKQFGIETARNSKITQT